MKQKQYNRIKEVLVEKGMTQSELADEMKLRFLTIHNYVANKRQPSIEKLYEIADILKVPVKDLLRDKVK